jgi:O-antigen ligase
MAVLGVSAALSLPSGQLAHSIAAAAGLFVFALAYAAPRLAVLAASWPFAVWMLIAPFVTPLALANPKLIERLPDSWAMRAGIWDYVCVRILENPWFGHGLDASRAVTDRITVRGLEIRGIPLHPHSASLQVWYETGLVGAALAAAALLVGGWALSRAAKERRAAAAAAAASLASLGVIANVSYGAWQEWWIATMFVAAALVGAVFTLQDARGT